MNEFIHAFAGRLRQEAQLYESRGLKQSATQALSYAAELEDGFEDWLCERLTLDQAEHESGYTQEALREMVRRGDLPDHRSPGSRNRIYIERRYLPIKPGHSNRPG